MPASNYNMGKKQKFVFLCIFLLIIMYIIISVLSLFLGMLETPLNRNTRSIYGNDRGVFPSTGNGFVAGIGEKEQYSRNLSCCQGNKLYNLDPGKRKKLKISIN